MRERRRQATVERALYSNIYANLITTDTLPGMNSNGTPEDKHIYDLG